MLDFATASELEDYLRVLQVAGMAPLHPWSLRGFSRNEVAKLVSADTAGPWKLRDRLAGGISAGPLVIASTFNSAFPYGGNDGPVWAGRGLTTSITGGFSAHVGPLSISIAPIAFRAANNAFELRPNGQAGDQAFNHGSFATIIDLPQRFGARAYSRLDAGASSIRFDSRHVSLGISTGNQWIGPATEYPFLLGTNAPGYPHFFVGTGSPANIWIGRVHGRVSWGRLNQSEYSPVSGGARFVPRGQSGTVRLATSASVVLLPRGVPGLEIGVARFLHVPYAEGEPSGDFWAKPFKVLFTKNEFAQGDSTGADNQLASLFFRWVFPRAGFEMFGERGYEDQFYDLREFFQNTDHVREYMLGFQKVFRPGEEHLDVVRAEIVNFQRSTLALVRFEGGVYLHSILRQGHTNRGQLLGANAGAGAAAASVLSWTRYSPRHRTGASFRRIVRDQRGEFPSTGVVDPRGSDVIIGVGFERARISERLEIGGKVEVMQNYNRNFTRDVANLNLQLGVKLRP
jgi:hypothetical protein